MTAPGADQPEEPQKERGAPGLRDTGAHGSAGGTERPSGSYQGDESVPTHGGTGEGGFDMSGEVPPQGREHVLPPYEDRKTSSWEGRNDCGTQVDVDTDRHGSLHAAHALHR